MIELILLNYLKNALDVPVLMEKPTSAEIKEFVLIEKTGSSTENHVNTAIFAVQSWSDSLYHAAELNEAVKNALFGNGVTSYGIATIPDISRCELNSDYEYTDTTTKSYRYQAVIDLVF